MEENKNLENLEEVTETAEEVVEEATEAATEVAEEAAEVVEEAAEVVEEVAEEAAEVLEDVSEAAPIAEVVEEAEEKVEAVIEEVTGKKGKAGPVVAIILVALIVIAAVVWVIMPKNKYNKMGYVDISGQTVQDMADQMGVSLEEFLAQYELPADMPGDTTESAAYYNIPVKIMANMFGMDYATMKETLKFPETITENSTWGEAEGEVLLGDYVGAENLDAFKAEYGFGDEITVDTKWKEVRTVVDTAQRDARIAQEEAMAAATEEAANQAVEGEAEQTGEVEEVPAEAEGETAEEVPAEVEGETAEEVPAE